MLVSKIGRQSLGLKTQDRDLFFSVLYQGRSLVVVSMLMADLTISPPTIVYFPMFYILANLLV